MAIASSHSNACVDLQQLRQACSRCSLAELCLPVGLSQKDMERLDALVKPSSPLHAGEYLYRVGDPFKSLYAVHSGYFKTYAYDDSGREQVLGFHLPGELMGLGAIYPDHHVANAVALDTATVCRLQYSELSALAAQIPSLQKQLFRLMSKDIRGLQALSGDYTAEERLASFLMSLSSRLHLRGYSAAEFLLAMKRRDIANYLRLATETVSRVFAKFQEDGLISVERREVRILDLPRLSDACHNVPHV